MDNELCKCGKVGKISCPHDERCGTDNTQLPAEVVEKILRARDALILGDTDEAYHQLYGIPHPKYDTYYPWQDMERQINYPILYEKAINDRRQVTEYAIKLHKGEQEIKELKQWKKEATELLNPILDYGQSKEAGIGLGESIISCRCGNMPDEKFLTEIKTFLDGTK